jgi:hypothetical protein
MILHKTYKSFTAKNIDPDDTFSFEDLPSIEADITVQEIVEIIRESRAGI